MPAGPKISVEPGSESGGHCDCCGNETRSLAGFAYGDGHPLAAYFVSWTRGQPSHHPNVDVLIGQWGEGAPNDRRLVAWTFDPLNPGFRVIDAASRPAARSTLCAFAMSRADVLADQTLLDIAKSILDAVWIGDERIAELQQLESLHVDFVVLDLERDIGGRS